METLEKICIQSYSAPLNLELKHCPPHNYLYDLPLQSREVSKQIDTFGAPPCFQPIKLSSSLTLPVFEPINFDFSDLQNDPLQSIIQEKEEYLFKLRAYYSMAKKKKEADPDFMKNVEISTRKRFFLDQEMVRLTEVIGQDPHPYFSETYLWLPIGGSIKKATIGNKTYMVTPDGTKYDQIRIVKLHSGIDITGAFPVAQNGSWKVSGSTTTADCSTGGRIFQLVCCKHKKKGFVGVRQLRKFQVIELKPLNGDGSLKARKLIDVSQSSDPLVALDISTLNGVQASTIDTSNWVKLYDVAAGKCTVDVKFNDPYQSTCNEKGTDGEGKFIQFSKQPFMIYIINKRKLYLKDTRAPFSTSGTSFNVYDLSDGCECLSVSAESVVTDTLYCSSTHHCYSLDPRRGWFKRWNHGLDNMPVYIDVEFVEPLKELVVTGTTAMGSTTGILQSWEVNESGISQSFCSFPAKMPSIKDTAFWANSYGRWLEPSIIKRIESSLCGIALIPNADEEGCNLFSLNAVGDVFSTTFRPDESSVTETTEFFPHNTAEAYSGEGIHRVQEWQENHMRLINRSQMNLYCDTLTDRSYLRTIMKQHLYKDALARDQVRRWKVAISKRENAPRRRPKYIVDKPLPESGVSRLMLYRDCLSNEILSMWNMDNLKQLGRTYNPEGPSVISSDSDDSSE